MRRSLDTANNFCTMDCARVCTTCIQSGQNLRGVRTFLGVAPNLRAIEKGWAARQSHSPATVFPVLSLRIEVQGGVFHRDHLILRSVGCLELPYRENEQAVVFAKDSVGQVSACEFDV